MMYLAAFTACALCGHSRTLKEVSASSPRTTYDIAAVCWVVNRSVERTCGPGYWTSNFVFSAVKAGC